MSAPYTLALIAPSGETIARWDIGTDPADDSDDIPEPDDIAAATTACDDRCRSEGCAHWSPSRVE